MSFGIFVLVVSAVYIYVRIKYPDHFSGSDNGYEYRSSENDYESKQEESEHYELLQMYKGKHYWYGIGTYSSESSAEQAGIWVAERHPEHRYKVVRVCGDRKSTVWLS